MSKLSRLCRQNIKEWESLERGHGTFTTRVQQTCTTSHRTKRLLQKYFANVIHLVITAKWSHKRITYLIYTPGKLLQQ